MKPVEFDDFFEKYKERRSKCEPLMNEGERTLREVTRLIKVHSITSRIKGFDSFYNKVMDKKTKKPFEDIKDFVGLRIVCLFLSDLERVEDAINKAFKVIDKDDKIDNDKKKVFGYLGIHFIVKLKGNNETDAIPFEIQVRTIAQDAWASVSHHLEYKANSIPNELKRDFNALSGLFYVADTHFEFIQANKQIAETTDL